MINYEWNVSDCEVYPNKDGLSDVVWKVTYTLTGVDDSHQDPYGHDYSAKSVGRV